MADINLSNLFKVPGGTTANRPANPNIGDQYYNGTLGYLEIYTSAGWIPAAGGNDFSVQINSAYTTTTLNPSYAAGAYSIAYGSATPLDIYAYGADGTLAGYTNIKSLSATQRISKLVILGATLGDVVSFSYKTTFQSVNETSETSAGPVITSITPSYMANINDTITITGRNFATNVTVTFTGSGYSATPAKNIVRSSATSLIVTRPDNFPPSASPYTITITNPSVANQPTGSNSNILSNSVTAGTSPVWNTNATLPAFTKNSAYSTTLSATDPDTGGSITYSLVSGSLATGLSFNTSTGVISGTPTSSINTSFTIRATDAGGNYVDRAFTMADAGPVWTTTSYSVFIPSGTAYSYQLVATDDSGTAPTYSIASGSLPSGLSLSSSGLISGTPSGSGTSTFTVNATDVNGNNTISNSFSIGYRTASNFTLGSTPTNFVVGDTISLPYSGSVQSLNLYNIKTFTTSITGGGGNDGDGSTRGGKGATVSGTVNNLTGTIYVVIGGAGGRGVCQTTGGAGGYNGGGSSFDSGNTGWTIAGGGGASHIATASGVLSSLSGNTGSVILVAGGGGAANRNGGSGNAGPADYPNGVKSTADGGGSGGSSANGSGGTQSSGGASGQTSQNVGGTSNGSFGQGGSYSGSYNTLSGPGGGGWYGGGAGTYHMGLGGGGSSYYNSSYVSSFSNTNNGNGTAANGSGTITVTAVN